MSFGTRKKGKREGLRVKESTKGSRSDKILSISSLVSATNSGSSATAAPPRPFEYYSPDEKEYHWPPSSPAVSLGSSDLENEVLCDGDLLPLSRYTSSRQRTLPVDERGITDTPETEAFTTKTTVIEGVDSFAETGSQASHESCSASHSTLTPINQWRFVGTCDSSSPEGVTGFRRLKNTPRLRFLLPRLLFRLQRFT